MGRVLTTLSVVTIVFLGAAVAQADYLAYTNLNNLQNATDDDVPGSPTATTGGQLWLDTGSGPVRIGDQDINMEFLGGTTPGSLTTLVLRSDETTPARFLLSDHTADGDIIIKDYYPAYPGYWGIFSDPIGNAWSIPGVSAGGNYYVKIEAWTGNFDSYAAAAAGGAYVGESTPFHSYFASGIEFPGDLSAMPAVVLRQIPEPATVLLAASGLLGLLAYAWRKRK
jgi:hypothetical protein